MWPPHSEPLVLTTWDGRRIFLGDWAGRPLLLVNTASHCGFTPQYAGLENLHRAYHESGLVVVAFPCNQFGAQEPGENSAIAAFCAARFGVSFIVSEKVLVNGAGTHPIFRWLKSAAPGVGGTEAIKWNFTKFLVAPDGRAVERFAPWTPPGRLVARIESLIHLATP